LSDCSPIDAAIKAEDFFCRTWASNTLGQWISAAQQLSNPPSREAISLIISGLINLVTNGNVKAFANATGLYPELVYNGLKKRSGPCLDFILRICSTFNLSLTELLTNQCFTSSALPLSETLDDLRHKVPATPTFNKTILLEVLTEVLNEEPPPSLQEIADRLGYKDIAGLRFTSRDLCKKITARYRSYIKIKGEKAHSVRNYETVRAALEQALEKDHPPSITKISSDLKYKCDKTLYQRFPDLCRRIMAKREEFKKQLIKDRERIMKAVLDEEPPPSLREVGRRFGANSANSIYRLFPELCQAIVARHSEWKKKCGEQMMLNLQAALKEEPPRPLKEIAKELGYTVQAVRMRHPQFCKMIAARYAAYQRKLIEEKKTLFREEVRGVAIKLIEQGIHPSEEQVKSRLDHSTLRNFIELNGILRDIRREFGLPTLGYGPASRGAANPLNNMAA
jgi:DNA-binding phage protein